MSLFANYEALCKKNSSVAEARSARGVDALEF